MLRQLRNIFLTAYKSLKFKQSLINSSDYRDDNEYESPFEKYSECQSDWQKPSYVRQVHLHNILKVIDILS